MRITLLVATFALAVASLPSVALAQNREHLQMSAELQMQQQQIAKLQLAVNQLAEALKATSKRADDAAEANVKALANQLLQINQMAGNLRTAMEKLDDNNVRVAQFTQELPGIRQGLSMLTNQVNVLVSLLQPPVNPTNADAGGVPPGPETGLAPVPQVSSPARFFQQAEGEYMSGHYDNAIDGFRELLDKFPNAAQAADAQNYIGQAYFTQKKCALAIPEFQKVITNYKDSPLVGEAYLMQGFCYQDLNRTAEARKMFQLVQEKYPNTPEAAQAGQRLRSIR